MYENSCPKFWTPLLDWRDVLVHDDFRLKTMDDVFTFRDGSKVVDLPDYVLVACLFFFVL